MHEIRTHLAGRMLDALNDDGVPSKSDWKVMRQIAKQLNDLIKWEQIMTRKTYRIELKIDFDDDSRHDIIRGIVQQYARDVMSSAMLLADGRRPVVALGMDDAFVGPEEIALMDEGADFHLPNLER